MVSEEKSFEIVGGRRTADDGAYLVFEVKHLIIVHTVTVRSTGEIPLGLTTDRLEIAVFFLLLLFFLFVFCFLFFLL